VGNADGRDCHVAGRSRSSAPKSAQVRTHPGMATILGYILVGLIVGLFGMVIVSGRDPLGCSRAFDRDRSVRSSADGWRTRCSPRAGRGLDPSILVAAEARASKEGGSCRRPLTPSFR
jgi:hypothetical protein